MRWFVAAKSPFTYGSWEYGDTYIKDIKEFGERVAYGLDNSVL